MSLVVELEQRWTVRVVFLQVKVVDLGLGGRVSAVLADVHLEKNNKTNYLFVLTRLFRIAVVLNLIKYFNMQIMVILN